MSRDLDLTDDCADLAPLNGVVDEPSAADTAASAPAIDPDEDLWPSAPPKGQRIRIPSLILSGLAVAGLGFAGGPTPTSGRTPPPR